MFVIIKSNTEIAKAFFLSFLFHWPFFPLSSILSFASFLHSLLFLPDEWWTNPVEIVKSGQNFESWPKSDCILKEMAVLCPSVIVRHKGEKATELFMAKSESLLCNIENKIQAIKFSIFLVISSSVCPERAQSVCDVGSCDGRFPSLLAALLSLVIFTWFILMVVVSK